VWDSASSAFKFDREDHPLNDYSKRFAWTSQSQWYEQFGFAPVAGAPAGAPTQKMYIDLLTVEAAGRQA